MREFYARQRRRENMKLATGAAISMLFGGLIFTMPVWMILLGIV